MTIGSDSTAVATAGGRTIDMPSTSVPVIIRLSDRIASEKLNVLSLGVSKTADGGIASLELAASF